MAAPAGRVRGPVAGPRRPALAPLARQPGAGALLDAGGEARGGAPGPREPERHRDESVEGGAGVGGRHGRQDVAVLLGCGCFVSGRTPFIRVSFTAISYPNTGGDHTRNL